MTVIKFKKKEFLEKSPKLESDPDEIPFVAATDLLKQQSAKLTDEEASAIALTLHLQTPEEEQNKSLWGVRGRLEAMRGR